MIDTITGGWEGGGGARGGWREGGGESRQRTESTSRLPVVKAEIAGHNVSNGAAGVTFHQTY